MHVLVIGSGGREHALGWKIAQSPLAKKISFAPGNAGTESLGRNVPIEADDIASLVSFAKKEAVDLAVVGPEAPLAAGIVDKFEAQGLRVFGPVQAAARLEGSKSFCRNLLRRNNVPGPEFTVFDSAERALAYVETLERFPVVVKADGLAAGKGVLICETRDAAENAVKSVMKERKFGKAGETVVIEDFIEGEEASILALTDGRTLMCLPSSQDHKRILDGDKGLNTGGMGAYSPTPVVTPALEKRIEKDILIPVIHGLRMEGMVYKGVLYAGLMITKSGPKVLEFNVRFGDPETQAVLMNLDTDLLALMDAIVRGELDRMELKLKTGWSVCVVMASGGYPNTYEKGYEISGLDSAAGVKDAVVFHAGTSRKEGKVVTAGGRVLGVTAHAKDLATAKKTAYEAVGKISYKDAYYRNDIADKGIGKYRKKASRR